MRIIPFPGAGEPLPDESELAQLEAALDGEARSPEADSWRELRMDVRALAPPMSSDLERELQRRIAERGPAGRAVVAASKPAAARPALAFRRRRRFGALAGAAATALIAVSALIAGPWRTGESTRHGEDLSAGGASMHRSGESAPAIGARQGAAKARKREAPGPGGSAGIASAAPAPSVAGAAEPAAGTVTSAPGRVQQLAASIGLGASAGAVQETADRVARLAVLDGGYVQSSHVQVQQAGASEAELSLELPSAKLAVALAELGRLAPVRAESRSSQDITNAYDADRQRVVDANAERRALLRALAAASTEGQIDSLRERLAQNRRAIAQAQSTLRSISRRASTSEVEVTVLGDVRNESGRSTLQRGLHDAGQVLAVTLEVLLIAAAILVPLALLLLALVALQRAWRRYRRERVLDAP